MKKRNLMTAGAAWLLALSLAACSAAAPQNTAPETAAETESVTVSETESMTPETAAETESATETAESPETEESGAQTLPTQDRAGKPITVPEEVNTIISLAPATTQILCDLGLAEKIVAVDSNSPMYAAQLSADVLQFNMMEPDLEQIMAAEADIVFVSTMSSQGGDDVFQPVRDAGVCVAEIPTSNSIEDVKKDVQFVADCVGMSAEGKALVAEHLKPVFGQGRIEGVEAPVRIHFVYEGQAGLPPAAGDHQSSDREGSHPAHQNCAGGRGAHAVQRRLWERDLSGV